MSILSSPKNLSCVAAPPYRMPELDSSRLLRYEVDRRIYDEKARLLLILCSALCVVVCFILLDTLGVNRMHPRYSGAAYLACAISPLWMIKLLVDLTWGRVLWYTVRLEAAGPESRVCLNNKMLTNFSLAACPTTVKHISGSSQYSGFALILLGERSSFILSCDRDREAVMSDVAKSTQARISSRREIGHFSSSRGRLLD